MQRLSDGVLGTNPKVRSRVLHGLYPILIYLAWCGVTVYSARMGYMTVAAARFMITLHVIGMVAFYPWVRSGRTAELQDSGLVMPQIIWGSCSTILGYLLNPPLRTAYLQGLCFVHLFGLFTLRPWQLFITGSSSVVMLLAMLGVMAHQNGPAFSPREETFKVIFACFIVALITWMSIVHSRVRGRLSLRKKALAQAVAQVHELVTRDALTGLFNRKHMQELLEREHQRQWRTGQPFCVALIDLDHFKHVNDTHGHQVGDEVLRGFAQAALGTLRETDILGRWGGEEFLILMPDTTLEPDALVALERLRRLMQDVFPSATAPALRITFSAGVAAHHVNQSVEQTIARADEALYQAKRDGRNATVLAQG
ncbi:MAG: GGDEF domain-containing protein [Acidobacteriota bacterium]